MRLSLLCSPLEQLDGITLGWLLGRVIACFKQHGEMAKRDHIAARVCVLIGSAVRCPPGADRSPLGSQFGIGKAFVVGAPEVEQEARW